MHKKQTSQEESDAFQTVPASRNYLMGKVVLLIGNDTAVLQMLIKQLAQKGADIALVCWQLPKETVRVVRDSVESLGQRFLFIDQAQSQSISANHLVQTIVANLGNLDVFIDLSTQKAVPAENKIEAGRRRPNWQFAGAILKELVQS